jgi:hypothetical protein
MITIDKGDNLMKLSYNRNSKNPTYYIQLGIRNGKKTTTRNVATIGKHSELLALSDDPLAYAKEQVQKYNEEYKNKKVTINFTVDFSEKVTPTADIASMSTHLNIGYFILQKIYQDLHLFDFFKVITLGLKITYDTNDINRFLTFDRILDPKSKLGTSRILPNFFENPIFDYQHILRFMDILSDHYDQYLEHLFTNSNTIIPRDTTVCYFDCTNFYFEIEEEDEDYVDEVTGEIIKGFRKYGFSKQHQPSPLVQMGLFMDGNGIPISMCLNPGNDNEQKCAIPLEEKITKMFKNKKFIYCADAGLGSLNIRKFNSMGGRAFIVTQSIKKLAAPLKTAVFNDYDYKLLSSDTPTTIEAMKSFDKNNKDNVSLYNDCVYKIIEVENLVDLGFDEEMQLLNGNTKKVKAKGVLKQRIIITFSRKTMEYQRHIRNKQIERAQRLIKNQSVEKVKKGSHDVTRFIKRTSTSKKGDKATITTYTLDESIIQKEEMYDGFYAIATNLEDDAKSIIAINAKRYKIEDCFRVLKTNFDGRPVNHRNRNRIVAHFMICYTALLVYRLLENKLDKYCGTLDTDSEKLEVDNRKKHFTTNDIIDTLKNMNVVNQHDVFYQSIYSGSEICSAFNGLYNLGLDKKYYLPKELHKIIKKLSR